MNGFSPVWLLKCATNANLLPCVLPLRGHPAQSQTYDAAAAPAPRLGAGGAPGASCGKACTAVRALEGSGTRGRGERGREGVNARLCT